MKKLLVLLMVLMAVALTGCFRADIGIDIKEDGKVDLKTKVVADPSMRQSLYQELAKTKHTKIVPVKAGRWTGYEAIDSYNSLAEMVKANGKSFAAIHAPEMNLQSEGFLHHKGLLYDYYVIDLLTGMAAQDNAVTHDINKVDLPGVFMTINLPVVPESTNAKIISADKKTLSWDVAVNPKEQRMVPVKVAFRIWKKGAAAGVSVLALVALAAGLFFMKKSSSAMGEDEKKKAKTVSFASLGVAALVIVYAVSQLAGTPSVSAEDRISPVYDANGNIIAQAKAPVATKDNKKEIKTNNSGKPSDKSVNKNIPSNVPVGVITGTEVRMREFGNTNSKVLGYFEKGEKVTILESKNGWHRVQRSDSSVGWVSGDFCKQQ